MKYRQKGEENGPKPFKSHQNDSENESKIKEKSRLRHGCVLGAFLEGFGAPKRGTVHYFPDHSGNHFPSKIKKMVTKSIQGNPSGAKSRKKGHLKMDAKKDAEKETKIMPKGFQNDAKMDAKIDEKTMRFRNLRFLVFYKEYNVKIVFLHDQACRKSIKNRSKINAKTRFEK